MTTRYPVLKKCVFLLPLFWVIRFFDTLIRTPQNFKKSVKDTTNILKIDEYIKNSPNHKFETENLDFKTVYFEYLMTGFRTSKGVNSTEFFNRFGIKLDDILQEKFSKYIEKNQAKISYENYHFLPEGMLFLNQFLVDIL